MNVTKIANKVLNSNLIRKIAPDNATDIAAKVALISTTSKATLAYNHTWKFCQVSIDSASNSTLFKSKMHKNKKYTVALLFLL